MHKTKGQIAIEFQNGLLIMLLFTTILLAAEMPMLQKIIDKQVAQYEQTKNIHNCALNDILTIYRTHGMTPVQTNGTCLYPHDNAVNDHGPQQYDLREFG